MRVIHRLKIIALCVYLMALGRVVQADTMHLGNMPAGKILFLGNSITATEQFNTTNMWGLTASAVSKDYAHLLAGKIDAATGGSLTMIPTVMPFTNPDGSIAQNGSNVVNIADVFERGYASYNASKIATQLAWKANIVVLQFGENIQNFDAVKFTTSLRTLMSDLKQSSNPEIFLTSYIMAEPDGVANIKRQLVAEDPAHRVYVDLTGVLANPANVGGYAHPSDAGMAVIADKMFDAMVMHSVPEPSSVVLLFTALGAMLWYARRRGPMVAVCACLLATGLVGRADAAQLGRMQVDKILFLGKSGNPHIFMPSYILGANAGVDAIKRRLCEEDPSHRVFVDLSRVAADPTNMGAYSHPNDKGMAMIADSLFQAMLDHSAAKPGSK